ncbi:porin family protein [Cecembia rubra]|uniref:Outer membrane protein with beta-barrel domain n=1 Tax=Cecembia rubra TaxID=1485585 RepID=A0A2P8DJ74_9BACT|nr:porin family protein [Cecembia rubra]PSK97282.1 outer membrane protein with beta-barrel domain [Cecembia rubra]
MKRIFIVCLLINLIASDFLFAQERQRTPIGGRPDIKGDLFLDFGFNTLNNKPDELRTNFLPSRTFNIYYQTEVKIGEATGLTFNPGIGVGTDKMAFGNDRTLFNNPTLGPESSRLLTLQSVYGNNISVSKNNVTLNYLDIPLEFRYHFKKNNYNKSMRVALGGKIGYLMNAHTKVEITDENGLTRRIKDRQSYGLNPLRYGVYTRMGFPGFNIWGYYGLNTVFRIERGPFNTEASQINFGVSFTLF